jgi:FlaA1/EpsC-like NDP-sugar epimerase
MSKSSAARRQQKRRKQKSPGRSASTASPRYVARDRTIYIGIVAITLFAMFLIALLIGPEQWPVTALAAVIVLSWLVNWHAFLAVRGTHMAHWKQALARLPLRCAGYGSKGGRPLDAAHNEPQAMKMVIISTVTSVVIIAVLAVLIVPTIKF